MKLFHKLILILTLCCLLAGCGQASEPETVPTATETEAPTESTEDPRISVEQLTMVVTEQTIPELECYPNLKEADLSGSLCYTAIIVYAQNHPEVTVTFTVDLGGATADNWGTEVTLPAGGTNFEMMMRNLVYLPQLEKIHLPGTSLDISQIEALQQAYPEIEITYTVKLLDQELDADTTELDLSYITPGQIAEVGPALAQMRSLEYVELMDSHGNSRLSKADVRALAEAVPGVKLHYTFQLWGKTISTCDDTVEFKNLSLGPDDEDELRDALSVMSGCRYFILDRCGMSNELLASIRADYDNVELVWKVFFGVDSRYAAFTNAETIRAVYNVTDSTCYNLRYCQDVKYMDIGHNETLTDLSFVGYMPHLEILIASGCAVSDLSGFENCQELVFLELAYCAKLSDISPLAGCYGLRYLNICYTKVSDLTPLDGLVMDTLFAKQTRVPPAEQEIFMQIHEGCIAAFIGKEPYAGVGWRYIDNGKTYTEIYKKVREVFNYDAADALIRNGAT